MRISEFSKKTNINKKTIHFYINNGLLHPEIEEENHYYSFNEENVIQLKRISLLRKLGVPIATIRRIKDYPGAVNYFLYMTQHQLKNEIIKRQTEIENIQMILNQLPPNATPQCLDTRWIEQLQKGPMQQRIDSLYPINNSYLIACFLLVPYVNTKPSKYRRFLWDQIAMELSGTLKDGIKYMEALIYQVDISQLSPCSIHVSRLMSKVVNSEDLSSFEELLQLRCHQLIEDSQTFEKWQYLYYPILKPLLQFYKNSSAMLLQEYNESYSLCTSKMQKIIYNTVHHLKQTDFYPLFLQKTAGFFDSNDELYSDYFTLFTFCESFYTVLLPDQTKLLLQQLNLLDFK